MAVIGINYEGGNIYNDEDELIGNDMVYHGVYLHTHKKELKFESGDFVVDWFNAMKTYTNELQDTEYHLSGSSTCDHFQGDGGKFDSAYLHMIDDEPVLKYIDREDEYWFIKQRDIFENGLEFFVNEGTKPTWKELVEYCKK